MDPLSRLAILEYYQRAISRLDVRIQTLVEDFAQAELRVISSVLAGLAAQKSLTLRERRRKEAFARRIFQALNDSAKKKVPDLVNQSVQIGTKLANMSTGETDTRLSTVNREAMTLLVENLIEDLGNATEFVGRRVDGILRREGLRIATENVPGRVPEQFQNAELTRTLKRNGITSFVDRAGREWTLENYSRMAVKSVTQEALNVSQFNILVSRGIDLIEINKSQNPCPECIPYDGKTFSLTGRAPGYPKIDKRPPYHPFCHHMAFASPLAFAEREASGFNLLSGDPLKVPVNA